ncbi:MAG TPA: hypothetical protein VF633_11515 [Brevundimonas sp.]|jgi:hypothetical protein
MKPVLIVLLGVPAAALAGGLALGAEVAIYMLIEAIRAGDSIALLWLSGIMVGLYAALFFVAGLAVMGLPVLWGLGLAKRSGPVSAALAGAVGATVAVTGMMVFGGVTDSALGFAAFLILPGALAGWMLWRIAFRPAAVTTLA